MPPPCVVSPKILFGTYRRFGLTGRITRLNCKFKFPRLRCNRLELNSSSWFFLFLVLAASSSADNNGNPTFFRIRRPRFAVAVGSSESWLEASFCSIKVCLCVCSILEDSSKSSSRAEDSEKSKQCSKRTCRTNCRRSVIVVVVGYVIYVAYVGPRCCCNRIGLQLR